jgi:hypothetical protein
MRAGDIPNVGSLLASSYVNKCVTQMKQTCRARRWRLLDKLLLTRAIR